MNMSASLTRRMRIAGEGAKASTSAAVIVLVAASFASLDDGLLIDITMGTLGHALVSGIIRFEVGEAQGDLSFSYPSDQTYLAATLRQLLAVLDGHATALDDAAPGPAGWLF